MRTEYRAHITIDGVFLEKPLSSRTEAMRWLTEQSERALACGLPVFGMGLSAPRYFSDITGLEMMKRYDVQDVLSGSSLPEAQTARH